MDSPLVIFMAGVFCGTALVVGLHEVAHLVRKRREKREREARAAHVKQAVAAAMVEVNALYDAAVEAARKAATEPTPGCDCDWCAGQRKAAAEAGKAN